MKIPYGKPLTTIQAIKEAYLKNSPKANEKPRNYLGASSMGHDCDRNLWYVANAFPQEQKPASVYWAAGDGYRSEDLVAELLRAVEGIELVTHDQSGNQFGFSKLDGKFKGHCDGFIKGIIEAPETWHVWENKCKNKEYFEKLKKLKAEFGEKNALKEWDFNYYIQAQLYMGEFGLSRHYLTCALAGTRDIESVRTEFNPAIYKQYCNRAERIIELTEAPDRKFKDKNFYKCKWCPFKQECWG